MIGSTEVLGEARDSVRYDLQNNKHPSLVSFILVAYNQEDFIEEAIISALNQNYEPLEIIISDDASTDQTFEIAKAVVGRYNGPHHVILRCNQKNMGINSHINLVVNQTHGEFIIAAAGDDISLPERTEKLARQWQAGFSGVFSNATLIDVHGDSKGLFVRPGYKHMSGWRAMALAGTHGAWGCTFAWEKKVFDLFGDMQENILGEDAVVPFRCALLNGVAYLDEPLVQYRDRGGNVSFWAREKESGKAEMIRLGVSVMRFKKCMYGNWRQDLGRAMEKGLIDYAACTWGQRVLYENTLLAKKMDALLHINFIMLMTLLPLYGAYFAVRMSRLTPAHYAFKKTVWKLLNGVLHYRMPKLHRKIRWMLGRNT